MKLIRDMINRPAVYRKLWVSLAAAFLAVANGLMGMALDEEQYSKSVEEVFNLVILLAGSFAVFKSKNDPL